MAAQLNKPELTGSQLQRIESVRQHFRLTDEELFWLIIDTGLYYIDQVAGWTEEGKASLKESALFWNWFTDNWRRCDLQVHDMIRTRKLQQRTAFLSGRAFGRFGLREYQQHHLASLGQRLPLYILRNLTLIVPEHEEV